MNASSALPLSSVRSYWVDALLRLANPVFTHLAAGTLKSTMPSGRGEDASRMKYGPLEALGRTLSGIAPWLEAKDLDPSEAAEQLRIIDLVKTSLARATDPQSPDFMNFADAGQPIVDTAFLALGLLRSRRTIWDRLDGKVQQNILRCLRETRRHKPPFNNWLLFSAMTETFLRAAGGEWDPMRIDYALRQHEQWYKGDGAYGDGPFYHWDYYNSFVIQPFLLEIVNACAGEDSDWDRLRTPILRRAQRYAAVQERMIAPDGTFPPIGRSLTYRFGVFHHLALIASLDLLPPDVTPAQVRCGLTAVLRRTLEPAGTFDQSGWLTIGLSGNQFALAEPYIGTGSLYICACGFAPLGLSPTHPFWSGADADWTAKKIWSGADLPADHCLDDRMP